MTDSFQKIQYKLININMVQKTQNIRHTNIRKYKPKMCPKSFHLVMSTFTYPYVRTTFKLVNKI